MNELTAVVLGASGLTGGLLVNELLNDSDYKTVRVLVRKTLTLIHPKLQQQIVDFNNKEDIFQKMCEGDVLFSCIGTTQKKVKGDNVLYEKIDHDIPVNAAEAAIPHHFKKFLIISSVGANQNASNFYLKLKGKTENSIKQFPFESISIFQPSLLNGRKKDRRSGEQIAETFMDLLSFLMLGPLLKYRAIGADNLARAMAFEGKQKKSGIHYYRYQEIMDMARELISEREEKETKMETAVNK
ncbi:MAG TPA: NAD(P)H-binding protein [Hanamia sp.]|nr:NAD(P)H-binding protein [Hanamia sp.]